MTLALALAGSEPQSTPVSRRGRTNSSPVVRNARYVVDGNLVTSQGVSAGIDMALWLVGRIHGRDHARAVRRHIQYEPAPPYLADEPLA